MCHISPVGGAGSCRKAPALPWLWWRGGHLFTWLHSGHLGSFWTALPSRIFRLLSFSFCHLVLCLLPDLSLSAGLGENILFKSAERCYQAI